MEATLGLPLPLTVLPKGVKMGQQKKVTCVKRVKAKTGVTSHLISVSRERNN